MHVGTCSNCLVLFVTCNITFWLSNVMYEGLSWVFCMFIVLRDVTQLLRCSSGGHKHVGSSAHLLCAQRGPMCACLSIGEAALGAAQQCPAQPLGLLLSALDRGLHMVCCRALRGFSGYTTLLSLVYFCVYQLLFVGFYRLTLGHLASSLPSPVGGSGKLGRGMCIELAIQAHISTVYAYAQF